MVRRYQKNWLMNVHWPNWMVVVPAVLRMALKSALPISWVCCSLLATYFWTRPRLLSGQTNPLLGFTMVYIHVANDLFIPFLFIPCSMKCLVSQRTKCLQSRHSEWLRLPHGHYSTKPLARSQGYWISWIVCLDGRHGNHWNTRKQNRFIWIKSDQIIDKSPYWVGVSWAPRGTWREETPVA